MVTEIAGANRFYDRGAAELHDVEVRERVYDLVLSRHVLPAGGMKPDVSRTAPTRFDSRVALSARGQDRVGHVRCAPLRNNFV